VHIFKKYHSRENLNQVFGNGYCFNPEGYIHLQLHDVNEERQFVETQTGDDREDKCPEITECLDKTPAQPVGFDFIAGQETGHTASNKIGDEQNKKQYDNSDYITHISGYGTCRK
jgi:hypothetical protein